jgi:hypothetical protein
MNQLTCELNGIKYLLMQIPISSGTNQKTLKYETKRLGVISQSIAIIKKGGLFSNTLIGINFLVPEENVIEFNNIDFTKAL